MKRAFVAAVTGALICAGFLAEAKAGTRNIPRPLPSHPGNICLSGVNTNGLEGATIRIRGEFGIRGRPVLSLRLWPTAD